MSSTIDGGETAPAATAETASFQPGPLVESMQIGLNIILGIERQATGLKDARQALIDGAVDLGEAEWALGEAARILSPVGPEVEDKPRDLSEFLHRTASSGEEEYGMYAQGLLKEVGLLSVLIGAESSLMERLEATWAADPENRQWLGKTVILRRPPVAVIREDDNCPNDGPLYRGLEGGEPRSPWYRGGDKAVPHGKLEEVSLEQEGRVVVSRGREATEVIQMFEAIEDPETGLVTHYIPRVSVEPLSRSDRLKQRARSAAVKRAGPDLPELT